VAGSSPAQIWVGEMLASLLFSKPRLLCSRVQTPHVLPGQGTTARLDRRVDLAHGMSTIYSLEVQQGPSHERKRIHFMEKPIKIPQHVKLDEPAFSDRANRGYGPWQSYEGRVRSA